MRRRAEIVPRRNLADILAEQPLELAGREARAFREIRAGERLLDATLHLGDDADQLRVGDAEPRAELHPLALVALAHAVVDELVGHAGGDLLPELPGDQGQHHVDRGRAARAGEARPVELEQLLGHVEPGELFAQRILVLPMDRAAVTVEQARLGQDIRAGADRADRRPPRGEDPEARDEVAVIEGLDVDPGADDCGGDVACVGKAAVDRDRDPVRGLRRLAVRRQHAPLQDVASGHAVGEPQRLDGRGEGDHGERRYEQKGDAGHIGETARGRLGPRAPARRQAIRFGGRGRRGHRVAVADIGLGERHGNTPAGSRKPASSAAFIATSVVDDALVRSRRQSELLQCDAMIHRGQTSSR